MKTYIVRYKCFRCGSTNIVSAQGERANSWTPVFHECGNEYEGWKPGDALLGVAYPFEVKEKN